VATETHEDFSEPILPGKGASDYERYLRTDDLLALQKTPEEQSHPDELLFQTVHQSSELWLKLGTTEVARATEHIKAGELGAALRLLHRASLCLQFIVRQLDMLEQMSPWEYQTIRRVLGHGSGFDSPGFREVRRVTPSLGEAFERIIGDQVVGTQGTPVEVLGKMIHHNFFPALWRARNQLTARAKDEEADESEVPGHGL